MYSFTETYETDMKSLTMFQYLMISGRMKQIRWRFFPNENYNNAVNCKRQEFPQIDVK